MRGKSRRARFALSINIGRIVAAHHIQCNLHIIC